MSTTLAKKDYKIIWISLHDPEKIIIEVNKKILENPKMKKEKLNHKFDNSLIDYINSWEIDNPKNISWTYSNVNDLISSLKN